MDGLFTPVAWVFARHPHWRDRVGQTLLRTGTHFYVLLAAGCAFAGFWDQFIHPFSNTLSNASFDWLMSHRPIPYAADRDIVVLDIDESSLAGMAPKYGRWPWPREVLGRVAAELESHAAQAVVFDILFADPDTQNPSSEAAFDRYVKGSSRSFYPIARLNPANDPASEIPLSLLNFATRDPAVAPRDTRPSRTIALLPPYFKSIYDSTRMGTHNAYPDADNVVRWQRNYEQLAGFRIPSLPYRMAQVLHWPLPQQPRGLMNWPRGDTPYATISFITAFNAAQSVDHAFFDRFAGKIVVIGSTAPSLNDIKATPVDRLHAGVYVLATAIDNTKHGTFLRPLDPKIVWLLELLLLVPSTWVFTQTELSQITAKGFVVIPTILIAISLLSVSASDRLADLSAPTALILTYFAIAAVFEKHQRDYAHGVGVFTPNAAERAEELQVACLPPTWSRHQVLELLRLAQSPIKLWRPPEFGLGQRWIAQGWVLWQLAPRTAVAAAASQRAKVNGTSLQWTGVSAGSPEPFALAQAIAAAATAPATDG
jgi:adenylate cyclase